MPSLQTLASLHAIITGITAMTLATTDTSIITVIMHYGHHCSECACSVYTMQTLIFTYTWAWVHKAMPVFAQWWHVCSGSSDASACLLVVTAVMPRVCSDTTSTLRPSCSILSAACTCLYVTLALPIPVGLRSHSHHSEHKLVVD